MTIAPPIDLAPRIASFDIGDFDVPTGREEEWRFTPVEDLQHFFAVQPGAGYVRAAEGPFVSVLSPDECGDTWIPTDLPSAVARGTAGQAVLVDIPADHIGDQPIIVDLSASASMSYGHVVVRSGAFSRATVVINHDLEHDVSGALVTEVGDGAQLTLVSVMDGPDDHRHLWQWHAEIGRDAHFVGAQVTLGGALVRVRPSVHYRAPGGRAELLGAFLAQGAQHAEHRVFVDHDQPHCSSYVAYKGALSGVGARSVWIGDILVRREATGIDTYEVNRNLLLDDGPRADSVPNLELETGDVVSAGHASATGRFDDEQLFYLQARGIPEAWARQLIVRGFFADVLMRIGDPDWSAALMARIEAKVGLAMLEEAE